ncbi:hypothetical protein H5410_031957 [Solanum commersonii]|uniref:Uncharacterized protein n=1 Tax=Solanum commersonii TaxID=4109 RepID=A0A9J5YIM0_SOLCO|nr:hypothetical protein H5410_031957 [Solanum commersonii]
MMPVAGKSPLLPIFHLFTMPKTAHFQSQMSPTLEFRCHLFQKFTRTSIKTLRIKLVGHHGQNGPFSRSNDPLSRLPHNLSSLQVL